MLKVLMSHVHMMSAKFSEYLNPSHLHFHVTSLTKFLNAFAFGYLPPADITCSCPLISSVHIAISDNLLMRSHVHIPNIYITSKG